MYGSTFVPSSEMRDDIMFRKPICFRAGMMAWLKSVFLWVDGTATRTSFNFPAAISRKLPMS